MRAESLPYRLRGHPDDELPGVHIVKNGSVHSDLSVGGNRDVIRN